MAAQSTRRTFLKSIGSFGVAAPAVMPRLVRAAPANSRVRHASIGANGMAWSDITSLTKSEHLDLVAVCDVDKSRMGKAKKKFPDAAYYQDYRKLFDKEEKQLDSVNVTVPDHMHAKIALEAMHRGKHVYCQKPLCHDIWEVRRLTQEARRTGVVTQMGIQIHSWLEYRMAVQMLRDGVIGKVREAHIWSDKSKTADGRPEKTDPVPESLDWEKWLGTAPYRPYVKDVYHPHSWRAWLDFGTGNTGDMGCHIFDPVVSGLGLTTPFRVRSEGPAPTKENWPAWAKVHHEFPGTPYTAGKTLPATWYFGGKKPSKEKVPLQKGRDLPSQGSVLIGEKGTMLLPHIGAPQLLPREDFADVKRPDLESKKGGRASHWIEFVDACRGEAETGASFDYSGPLTEAVLLGNVASFYPKKTLYWDATRGEITNLEEANEHLRRTYREGWKSDLLSWG